MRVTVAPVIVTLLSVTRSRYVNRLVDLVEVVIHRRHGETAGVAGGARGNGDVEVVHRCIVGRGGGCTVRYAHHHGLGVHVARGAVHSGGHRDFGLAGPLPNRGWRHRQRDATRRRIVIIDGAGGLRGGNRAASRFGQLHQEGLVALVQHVLGGGDCEGLSAHALGKVQLRRRRHLGVVGVQGRARASGRLGVPLHRHCVVHGA